MLNESPVEACRVSLRTLPIINHVLVPAAWMQNASSTQTCVSHQSYSSIHPVLLATTCVSKINNHGVFFLLICISCPLSSISELADRVMGWLIQVLLVFEAHCWTGKENVTTCKRRSISGPLKLISLPRQTCIMGARSVESCANAV